MERGRSRRQFAKTFDRYTKAMSDGISDRSSQTMKGCSKPQRGGVALPGAVTFTDNGNGTGTLAGTPDAGTGGT